MMPTINLHINMYVSPLDRRVDDTMRIENVAHRQTDEAERLRYQFQD